MHSHTPSGDKLTGKLALTFKADKSFIDFCINHFENFHPDQFEPVAIRIFQATETVITLFALDKNKQEGSNFNPDKMPVRKFKSTALTLSEIMPYVLEFNFTLSPGNYDLEDMEVFNK